MTTKTRNILIWIAVILLYCALAAFGISYLTKTRKADPVRSDLKELKDLSKEMREENRALKLKLDTIANDNKAMTTALEAAQKHINDLDKNYQTEAARNRSEIRATRAVVEEKQALRSRMNELAKSFEPVKMDD